MKTFCVLLMVYFVSACAPTQKRWILLGTNHNSAVENYYILLSLENESEEHVREVMHDAWLELHTGTKYGCNIFGYKNQQGYEADVLLKNEKQALSESYSSRRISQKKFNTEMSNLYDKHYVLIAESLVASLSYSNREESFLPYPYKDHEYFKRKGETKP